MTALNKQALREAAERAKDSFIPNFRAPTRDVLELLDELEAKDITLSARDYHFDQDAARIESLEKSLEAAEKRIAELESRTVTLPAEKFCPSEYAGSQYWEETEVWNKAISACAVAIRATGIGVKGE